MVHDTLIRNAFIVDGKNNPVSKQNVAIRNDRISLISDNEAIDALTTIDAEGLYLAPGFIDVHTHDDIVVIKEPKMHAKLSQGVTSVIVGNCGISASPVSLTQEPPDPMNLLGEIDDFRYPDFASYAGAVEKAKPAINVGALIGHTSLRNNHLNNLKHAATDEEIRLMREQLRTALQQGALGMSSGLAYENAKSSPPSEVKALVEELKHYDGIYTTHLRSEFDDILHAMDEAFDTAGTHDTPLIISHLKCAGAGNWGRSQEILNRLDIAALRQDVACDCYPYSASSSTLDLEQVNDEIKIFITWSSPYPEFAGKYLNEIAEAWDMDLVSTASKLQPAGAIYYCMDDNDVNNILSHPLSMVGSDGLPNDPHPHPRLWGTFPRVISHYVREKELLTLAEAIYKMTGLSAKKFRLKDRGVIENNAYADLVLFDLNSIKDKASYQNPKQAADGISKVWVNGCLSYNNKECTDKRAGRFMYRNS